MRKVLEITMVLLLVLSLFSVLVIMNAPTVEATNDPQDWQFNDSEQWETYTKQCHPSDERNHE
jgi:hypothetical protein